MTTKPLKPGWKRVKFGEVVRLSKERSSDPLADGYERYLGLDHLEPGDLRIRRWGNVADGVTFTSVFKPGQVLFGKRRAYQRKVAVADFAGVCSGDIYVFESANPKVLLPELLPFLCQTDAFFEHAVGTSAGSLSPRTNWTSLADFEFALPPLEEQKRQLILLNAMLELQDSLSSLKRAALKNVRSLIDGAMFAPENKFVQLGDVVTRIADGVHQTPKYIEHGIPFLTVENLTRTNGIDFTETRYISQSDHEEFTKRVKPEFGDVLVSKDGTLGVARYIDFNREFSIFVSVALLKPKAGVLDGSFLRYYFESSYFLRRISQNTSGSAIKHIHLGDFRKMDIPLPSISVQQEIAKKAEQIEKTVSAIAVREFDLRNQFQLVFE